MSQDPKVWFITGIGRGFGRELAQAALDRGDQVIGTTRSGEVGWPSTSRRLHVLPLDLPDPTHIRKTVASAHALYGRLDVVINNAGYGLMGAIEESSVEECEHIMDVNFFGPLQLIQAVLPFLRAQGSGHIVNISSIAGFAPMGGYGLYSASKFALEGLSESLAREVEPLGIRVTLVEPGAFRTDFLKGESLQRAQAAGTIASYAETAGRVAGLMEQMNGRQPGDPARGARAIIEAVLSDTPPSRLLLGTDALNRAREKVRQLTAQIDRWEHLSRSTDFPQS